MDDIRIRFEQKAPELTSLLNRVRRITSMAEEKVRGEALRVQVRDAQESRYGGRNLDKSDAMVDRIEAHIELFESGMRRKHTASYPDRPGVAIVVY